MRSDEKHAFHISASFLPCFLFFFLFRSFSLFGSVLGDYLGDFREQHAVGDAKLGRHEVRHACLFIIIIIIIKTTAKER